MRNKKNSFKSAFTLIELLVVMSIIVVLAGIILPKIGSAKNKAVMVSCQSNMKGIVKSMQLYSQDYPAFSCPGRVVAATGAPVDGTEEIFGAMYYQADGNKVGGLTAMDIYVCPALKETHNTPVPAGWNTPIDITNGSIDYVIITSDGIKLPNFLSDPDSNAIMTEKTANHGVEARNVAFLGGNIKLMTNTEIEAFHNIDTDPTTGGVPLTNPITHVATAFISDHATHQQDWNSGIID